MRLAVGELVFRAAAAQLLEGTLIQKQDGLEEKAHS